MDALLTTDAVGTVAIPGIGCRSARHRGNPRHRLQVRAHLVGPEQTEASHAVLTTLHHPGNQDEEELSELSGAGNRAA